MGKSEGNESGCGLKQCGGERNLSDILRAEQHFIRLHSVVTQNPRKQDVGG